MDIIFFSLALITPKATHTWTEERGELVQVQILNILVKRKIVSGGSSTESGKTLRFLMKRLCVKNIRNVLAHFRLIKVQYISLK